MQTLGEELALIRQRYLQAEARAAHAADREFTGGNWDGDVYVGSNWNMLSFLALCMWLLPIIGLVFAYLTYGTLWGVDTMYASPNVMW